MLGDPAIPKDNTYQVTLVNAGVTYVLDAGALDKSVSKGQFINDGLAENASDGHPTVPMSTALCTLLMTIPSTRRWRPATSGSTG